VNAETECAEEEHDQLPPVEDVSKYRWSEEEEVSNDGLGKNNYFGMSTAYEGEYVQYCIAKVEASIKLGAFTALRIYYHDRRPFLRASFCERSNQNCSNVMSPQSLESPNCSLHFE
jgi:hypothetical protein